MITNWIGDVRQILVSVDIEFRDVEDILIVTLFKVRERASATTLFSPLIYFNSGPNSLSIRRQRITRSVLNIILGHQITVYTGRGPN